MASPSATRRSSCSTSTRSTAPQPPPFSPSTPTNVPRCASVLRLVVEGRHGQDGEGEGGGVEGDVRGRGNTGRGVRGDLQGEALLRRRQRRLSGHRARGPGSVVAHRRGVHGIRLFDASRSPLLEKWVERFGKLDEVVAVLPDIDRLVEHAKVREAEVAAAAVNNSTKRLGVFFLKRNVSVLTVEAAMSKILIFLCNKKATFQTNLSV
ncbi:hypothetical protein PVAP13_9NG495114 [Panicum virgatum]|uniref:Uncharacterized protein n=1 Tax=Panicum virgatum TaxID=38727 RepID=A0A8T0MUI0_PANVG|nr:hypothetical protein PVAP13_9NG495114 [Panicum virgatum]